MNEDTRNRTVTDISKDMVAYGAIAYTAVAVVICVHGFVSDFREIKSKQERKLKNEK